jgi:hypothetical protein
LVWAPGTVISVIHPSPLVVELSGDDKALVNGKNVRYSLPAVRESVCCTFDVGIEGSKKDPNPVGGPLIFGAITYGRNTHHFPVFFEATRASE